MAYIVVVGSLNIDLIAFSAHAPCQGETVIGERFEMAPGGKGANQAVAAAKLGASVAMCGRIGLETYGALLKAQLAAAGCDARCVRALPDASGMALVTVEIGTGANRIIVFPGANGAYSRDEWREDAAILVGAKVALFQLETPQETSLEAAKTAKAAGAKVMLDPAPAGHISQALLQLADFVTPNETELSALIGRVHQEMSERDLLDAVSVLRSQSPATIVAKLGARGCLAASENETLRIAAPSVRAIDTTAAGDIFNGAFAVAISEGATLAQACAFAIHASAISVTRLGAQASAPSRQEVEAAMRAHSVRPTIIRTRLRTTP